jgi:hypothetical protein
MVKPLARFFEVKRQAMRKPGTFVSTENICGIIKFVFFPLSTNTKRGVKDDLIG